MAQTTCIDDAPERRAERPDGRPLRHDVLAIEEMAAGAAAAAASFRAELACVLKALTAPTSEVAAIAQDLIGEADRIERLVLAQGREIRRLRDDLDAARDDAGRDALTGLPNRRAAETALARPSTRRSVAFVDVDRFKSLNDRYGHGFGDRVLRHIASVLVDVCGADAVHRWGGEEFLVVLDGLGAGEAARLVDEARIAVSEMEIKLRENDPPLGRITFSAGVDDDADSDKAVAHADKLLYYAKSHGRDRVASSHVVSAEDLAEAA